MIHRTHSIRWYSIIFLSTVMVVNSNNYLNETYINKYIIVEVNKERANYLIKDIKSQLRSNIFHSILQS